jgi:hypothetical protein
MSSNQQDDLASIILGGIFGAGQFLVTNNFILDFGIDLLKVCLFGFAGGVFGLIGKQCYTAIVKRLNNK